MAFLDLVRPDRINNDANASINTIISNVEKFVIGIAFPLAIIALFYTGFILITSAGKPEAYKKAKQNFTYVVIGIFIVVFATTIVSFAVSLLTLKPS